MLSLRILLCVEDQNLMLAIPPTTQVASLILEVQRVHARLGTLGDFNYRMSEEDIRLSWKTMDYPTVRRLIISR